MFCGRLEGKSTEKADNGVWLVKIQKEAKAIRAVCVVFFH